MLRWWVCLLGVSGILQLAAQKPQYSLSGRVTDGQKPVPYAAVALAGTRFGTLCDSLGRFSLQQLPAGPCKLLAEAPGFLPYARQLTLPAAGTVLIALAPDESQLNEVVVTGNLREMRKDDSPVNVDVVTPALFRKTAVSGLFEAAGMLNGVKPQINCNVCNTGDIHINGMEGPYTLILIDGMPIVSGLSSVYGLMGIPTGLIERLEVAKGPAGALYGTEAMGGTINLITKKVNTAPRLFADYFTTSYFENNLDVAAKMRLGKKLSGLIGANGFLYNHGHDINADGFTDIARQQRLSLFNKLSVERAENRELDVALRLFYEDRWGGQTHWEPRFRGGDSVYGESIYTGRAEFISKYQWPVKEKIVSQVSYNYHAQNSAYGESLFNALQSTAFSQTYWNRAFGQRHHVLAGLTYKHLWYDDNTAVTLGANGQNKPESNHTGGAFGQYETRLDSAARHTLLLGMRLDYHSVYKWVPSPRVAYKWSPTQRQALRVNFGTGFRIVNVFAEDHAALTGARQVVFVNRIRPEQSYNAAINYLYKMKAGRGGLLVWDAGLFYYYFTNKIFADYDANPTQVIFDNLAGFAFSRGAALNVSLQATRPFKLALGVTYVDVQNVERDSTGQLVPSWQLLTPRWSGNFLMGYEWRAQKVKLDVTGNWYGPQRLPVQPNDFRPTYSPWFCLLNLQVGKTIRGNYEGYVGVKNLLNFLPNHPIMRPQDPFNKQAGDLSSNPNGYVFDPSYNYAPMQGRRFYLGVRLQF